jgi:phenylacetate-coenzyme A ligase PaaK-like adenylate-forming protein
MELSDLLAVQPYALDRETKTASLLPLMNALHQHHAAHSPEFRTVCDTLFSDRKAPFSSLSDLPFLPVSAFKNHSLRSIPESDVFKVLTSSGTTGQAVSRIFLDRETARLQTLALSKIIGHVVGKERLPMLVIDSKAVLTDRTQFSARGAGILGLSVFGKDHTYMLDAAYAPDEAVLKAFLDKYSGQRMLIFGFTYMVRQFLAQAQLTGTYDLSKAILIHSGGWKKLAAIAVTNDVFRATLHQRFGLSEMYNFYGMVEQVGSVFLENSNGFLHCPNFAEVIIRDPYDFSVLPAGKPGLIQVLSALPLSYPGHSLLTEDIGVLEGEDDAANGWKGRYFRILGRAKKAELRGCSDTFAQKKGAA